MYKCTECGKKYARQNTLTRHLHNHRRTKRHICPVCKVVFYRGDLLSRHVKLHDDATTSHQERNLQGQTARRRCHTACARCREHKTKCDGQHPCSTCVKVNSQAQCEYNSASNRLSHIPTTSEDSPPISAPPEFYDDNNSNSDPPDDASQVNEQDTSPVPTQLAHVPPGLETISSFNTEREVHHSSPQVQPTTLLANATFLAAMEQNVVQHQPISTQDPISQEAALHYDSQMFDAVSWPWLHESLYLPKTQNSLPNSMNSTGTMDFTRGAIANPFIPDENEAYNFQFSDASGEGSGLQSISNPNPQPIALGFSANELAPAQPYIYGNETSPAFFDR